jgi:hypothetical protein
VRVVSVDEQSQAHLADLRPEDVVIRVGEQEVHSIDQFAELSHAHKGRTTTTTLLVFRNGKPLELSLHLYSYPVLEAWGVRFIPDHDVRFAQPQTGRDYWMRLGRGFEQVGNDEDALDAYLNALHNVVDDGPAAMKVSELFARLGRRQLQDRALAPGFASLRQSLVVMQHLFDEPLSEAQLQVLRDQLRETLHALRDIPRA